MISKRCANNSTTATTRSYWTPKSTPTSVPNNLKKHSITTKTNTLAALATTLTNNSMRVINLTQPLSKSTPILILPPPFANTPNLSRKNISRYDNHNPTWAWTTLTLNKHIGTHFDAPIHWITNRNNKNVTNAPPTKLVTPCVVIDKSTKSTTDPNYLLTLNELKKFKTKHDNLPTNNWLFLRTN